MMLKIQSKFQSSPFEPETFENSVNVLIRKPAGCKNLVASSLPGEIDRFLQQPCTDAMASHFLIDKPILEETEWLLMKIVIEEVQVHSPDFFSINPDGSLNAMSVSRTFLDFDHGCFKMFDTTAKAC